MKEKYYLLQCKICEYVFESSRHGKRYCPDCKSIIISRKKSNPHSISKRKKLSSVCTECGLLFNHSDYKAKICYICAEPIEIECKCGCGRIFKRKRYKAKKNPFWNSCDKRGKTYLEIYGTENPGCGFKTGGENPNFTTRFSKLKYNNNRNERFRSKLEIAVADFLFENNIPYKNEVVIQMNNGRRKIVDFVLYGNIILEVSGFSYDTWRNKFIEQIDVLRKSIDNPIIILTYDFNIKPDSKIWNLSDYDIIIHSAETFENLNKTINFFRTLVHMNTLLFGDEYLQNINNFIKNKELIWDLG